MRRQIAPALALVALLVCETIQAQTPAAANPFAGRWEITLTRPKTVSDGPDGVPFAIIEITGTQSAPVATLLDVLGLPLSALKPMTTSLAGDQLTVIVDAGMFKLTLKATRVGDHLEGTAAPDGATDLPGMIGTITTKDKIAISAPHATPDVAAFNAAMAKSGTARLEALKQLLIDFPTSPTKEAATLELALGQPFAADKIAALKKFVDAFPASRNVERAQYQIALAPVSPEDRRVALKAFVADHRGSVFTEEAQFKIAESFPSGPQRDAAMVAFVDSFPDSGYAQPFFLSRFQAELHKSPIDDASLDAAIKGYTGSSALAMVPILKVMALNTIADQLMVNGVALPKAKTLIDEALSLDDKRDHDITTMLTTTHGQVLFKLKDFAAAEGELKHANEIKGGDGELEAHLYLGKVYEATGRNDDALAAYFKAANIAYTGDTKMSLDRLYVKMNGGRSGLDALEAKLDEMERAKPKPFDAGHFARPAAKSAGAERVVLAELFTGAECGPCVASDLAFDGLEERYDRNTVAVLIYHLHVPGPDPMTNPDSVARGQYYGVPGTPTVVVDGLTPETMGGSPSMAGARFDTYTKRIEARLAAAPRATLSGFKATSSGSKVTVTGQASVSAGTGGTTKATVHVALVQDVVRYTGSNGVRRHNLVVRKLMGTPAGTPLGSTAAAIAESVDVSALGGALDAYLANYEKTGSRTSANFSFSDRVDQLDASHLSVVVFVQDDTTKEILQALVLLPGR